MRLLLAFHSGQDGQQGGEPVRTTKGLWAKLCLIPALAALGGCANSTPDCGADETLELLQGIVERPWKELMDFAESQGIEYSTKIDLVTMEGRDETLDNYECSARWTLIEGEREVEEFVSYSVRTSATDPDEFVVIVH